MNMDGMKNYGDLIMSSTGPNTNAGASSTDQDPLVSKQPFNEDAMALFFINGLTHSKKKQEQTWHIDLDRWEMDYRDIKPPKVKPWVDAANFSTPVSSMAADAVIPRLVEDLYDYNEPIEMQSLDNTEDGPTLEKEANKLMKWDIESHDDLREQIWYYIENACYSGNAFTYTTMESEKEVVEEEFEFIVVEGQGVLMDVQIQEDEVTPAFLFAQNPPQDVQPMEPSEEVLLSLQEFGHIPVVQTGISKKQKWKKYGPKSTTWDNKGVVWPSDAESLDDAFATSFVGLKVCKTLNDIFKILNKNTESNEKNLLANLDKIRARELSEIFREVSDPKAQKALEDQVWRSKKMEFHLMFGQYDIDNDDLEEKVVLLVHEPSQTLLGWEEFGLDHGDCPIVNGVIKPRHKKVTGVGLMEMLYDSKGYLDALRNQRTDLRSLYIAPPRKYTKESGFNPATHKPGIGSNWELLDVSDNTMRIEHPPNYTGDSYQEEDVVRRDIQQRVAVNPNVFAAGDAKNQTFRGIMQLLEEGSKSRSMFKRWLAQGIQKIFYQRWRVYQQFWGREARKDPQVQEWVQQIIDSPNNPLTAQTLDALEHNFNLVLKATHDDKKVELARVEAKAELLGNHPLIQQSPPHQRKMLVELLQTLNDKDPESSVPTLEEIQEYQVQVEMEAQRRLAEEAKEQELQDAFEDEKSKERGRQEMLDQLTGGRNGSGG
jgi:hypothetical protein